MSKRSNHFPRSAGILLPLFSVPEEHGPGTLNGAYDVLKFLKSAGMTWWQMLPLTLPDSTGSPYASPSTMGWGWHIISREAFIQRGWIESLPTPFPRRNDRRGWDRYQRALLWKAWNRFSEIATPSERRSFEKFCAHEKQWLPRHALFLALRDRFGDQPWWTWPERWRDFSRAQTDHDRRLQRRIEFHSWVQWVAEEQWQAFRHAAHQQGVKIIGDVPFFVRADSVAVWSQPHFFSVPENGQVKNGVGAPPDAFAKDGQWWGNPAYEWSAHASSKFLWWQRRVAWAASKYDALRLDHFHGYLRTWTISGRSRDPRHGTWSPTPSALLSIIRSIPVPVIVEDLGAYFPEAELVRKKLGVLGTRVFEFGWNGFTNNPHALDSVTTDTAYYTTTHDLPPLRRWLKIRKYRSDVMRIRERLGRTAGVPDAVTAVLNSSATLSLFPMSDLLHRTVPALNTPGTSRGNWRWQMRRDDLDLQLAQTLRTQLRASKRFLV